jgi:hypothetical protein
MSDANDTVKSSIDGLGKALNSLFQVSNGAVSVLNGLGMTSTASSLKGAVQKADQVSQSAVDQANQTVSECGVLECSHKSLVPALEKDLAPVLAGVTGFVADLNGRQERNWRGLGARAYSGHTDLQAQAATELSKKVLDLASIITDSYKIWKGALTAIVATFCAVVVAIGAAAIAAPPPSTPLGVAILIGGLTAFVGGLAAIMTALRNGADEEERLLNKLRSAEANGGSTVISGHWPSRELY